MLATVQGQQLPARIDAARLANGSQQDILIVFGELRFASDERYRLEFRTRTEIDGVPVDSSVVVDTGAIQRQGSDIDLVTDADGARLTLHRIGSDSLRGEWELDVVREFVFVRVTPSEL